MVFWIFRFCVQRCFAMTPIYRVAFTLGGVNILRYQIGLEACALAAVAMRLSLNRHDRLATFISSRLLIIAACLTGACLRKFNI